eukprot:g4252.t1
MSNTEADGILMLALRQGGVQIPDGVAGLKDFDASVMIGVVSQSLKIIHQAAGSATSQIMKMPEALPKNVASRHRVCTLLGGLTKSLGYMGETGYNQFLYPNEKDARTLVIWLVEKLPKEEGKNETIGAGSLSRHKTIQAFKAWSRKTWVPPFASGATTKNNVKVHSLFVPGRAAKNSFEIKYGNSSRCRDITRQVATGGHLAPSVFQRNMEQNLFQLELENIWNELEEMDSEDFRRKRRRDLALTIKRAIGTLQPSETDNEKLDAILGEFKSNVKDGERSRFKNQTNFSQESDDLIVDGAEAEEKDEDAVRMERENKMKQLEEDLQSILNKISKGGKTASSYREKDGAAKTATQTLNGAIKIVEKDYKVKAQTLKLLPNAEENIKKLQGICAASSQRLKDFESEWEKVKKPLMAEYEVAKNSVLKRKEEGRWKVQEMRRMREEMRDMATAIREAEEKYKLLQAEFKKMPKSINRAVYTYRIMDIIKQIRKQQGEVDRIVADIKSVQRALNSISQKLTRTEAITDEHVFQAAKTQKNDPAYVSAYRNLSQVREIFDDLVATAEKGGKLENATRDYENRAEQLGTRITSQNMDSVLADLDAVKKENSQLKKKLKSLQ